MLAYVLDLAVAKANVGAHEDALGAIEDVLHLSFSKKGGGQ